MSTVAGCRRPPSLTGHPARVSCGAPAAQQAIRYPADQPAAEEIVAVMRQAGTGVHGARVSGLIVVLWRAGLRPRSAPADRGDLDEQLGAPLVRNGKGGKRREVGMD